jgi:Domain of unknown function (DUF3854)
MSNTNTLHIHHLNTKSESCNNTSQDFLQATDLSTKFYKEFVDCSAIEPGLYHANVEIVADEVIEHGGEVFRPIANALNWNSSRWQLCGKDRNYGAIIKTVDLETGELIPFQVKLANPIYDKKRNRYRKYENPAKRGQVGGFACISHEIWERVAARNLIPMPDVPNKNWYGKEFWNWAIQNNLDIIITEGFKKAASLISLGYCAIALSGITMGRKTVSGVVSLQNYLEVFATQDRNIYFCFDAETNLKTKFDVYLAECRTGKLFADKKCNVKIIKLPLLPNTDKTGVDDLIVAKGSDLFQGCLNSADDLFFYEWSIKQSHKLTTSPSQIVNAESLLNDVNSLPSTGIIAIASGKGTEKTKLIAREIANDSKVVALTHLISLGKNLSKRFNLQWRNNLDSAKGFGHIGDTSRIALCIHSLLAINPRDYVGCTLVLDEVCQLLRCVLTNPLCNKDGKRAALLARLEELTKVAGRVIIADADLSDAEIKYIKALRGDSKPVYLIRNDYKSKGYNTRFIYSHNDKAIISELIDDLKLGHKVMVGSDSKDKVETITKTIKDLNLNLRVMTIHSDNSGCEIESNFIENINDEVLNYDVLICSPSLNTGVSIEVFHFDKVYGIYEGVLPDSDYCQNLIRYRPLVDRVIWCKKRGLNLSKVSKSTYPKVIQNSLKVSHEAEISLIRSSLNPDLIPFMNDGYSFNNNPHIELFSHYEATQNEAMYDLRDCLVERLKFEGNNVEIVDGSDIKNDETVQEVYKLAKEFGKEQYLIKRVEAEILTGNELNNLDKKGNKTSDEIVILDSSKIAAYYGVESLSKELLEFDDKGKVREKIAQLEAVLFPKTAISKDTKAIKKQHYYGVAFGTPWDIPKLELKRKVREMSGFSSLFERMLKGESRNNDDLAVWYKFTQKYANDCDRLGFAAKQKKSAIYLFRRWCEQCSIPTIYDRKKISGVWAEKVSLDFEQWEFIKAIVERRAAKRGNNFIGTQLSSVENATPEPIGITEVESGHNSFSSLYINSNLCSDKVTESYEQSSPHLKKQDLKLPEIEDVLSYYFSEDS